MSHEHNRLRIVEFNIPDGRIVSVNRTYRHGVGYRAIIRGEAGKTGDSQNNPIEALGRLYAQWIEDKSKEELIGELLLESGRLEEVKWKERSNRLTAQDAPTAASLLLSHCRSEQPRRK